MKKYFFLIICACLFLSFTACAEANNIQTNSGSEVENEVADNEVEVVIDEPIAEKKQTTEETTEYATKEITDEPIENGAPEFYITEINNDLYEKIYGKSYKENCTVPIDDLRYLHIVHIGFDGLLHEGEIICNKAIADELLEIFEKLYEAKYEIEKVRLVDEYDAIDENSMSDNNSSCFNFRLISNSNKISKHGFGMAIDINPLYNPYVKNKNGKVIIEPLNAGDYSDRSKNFPHKMDENDFAVKLFKQYGYSWGGNWKSSKDYQHFEK